MKLIRRRDREKDFRPLLPRVTDQESAGRPCGGGVEGRRRRRGRDGEGRLRRVQRPPRRSQNSRDQPALVSYAAQSRGAGQGGARRLKNRLLEIEPSPLRNPAAVPAPPRGGGSQCT